MVFSLIFCFISSLVNLFRFSFVCILARQQVLRLLWPIFTQMSRLSMSISSSESKACLALSTLVSVSVEPSAAATYSSTSMSCASLTLPLNAPLWALVMMIFSRNNCWSLLEGCAVDFLSVSTSSDEYIFGGKTLKIRRINYKRKLMCFMFFLIFMVPTKRSLTCM